MECTPKLRQLICEGRWSKIRVPENRPEYVMVRENGEEEQFVDFSYWLVHRVVAANCKEAWDVYRAFFRPREMASYVRYMPLRMLNYLKDDLLKESYWTLYYLSYRRGDQTEMDWFLSEGADINEIHTSLHRGVICSSSTLLLYYVKRCIYYHNRNPLECEKHITMIEYLLEHGADPLLENRLGVSPLGWLRDVSLTDVNEAIVRRMLEMLERWE
jgi:hypothetical protein